MTVGQLINKLEKLEKDREVLTISPSIGYRRPIELIPMKVKFNGRVYHKDEDGFPAVEIH